MGAIRDPSRFAGRIARIQVIQHRRHGLQRRVIVLLQRAGSRHDGSEAGGLGDGDSAHIKVVDQSAKPGEPGVLLQTEARQQNLEGYFGAYVRELSTIEVKTHGTLRAVLPAFEPQELRPWIDAAPNEPCRSHPVDPQAFACGPGTAAIVLPIARADQSMCGMRLIRCEACIDRGLRVSESACHLLAWLAG